MTSIEKLIKGINFKDEDSKNLASLISFSHADLSGKITHMQSKIHDCEDGIHCNEGNIKKLQNGDLVEKAARDARRDMVIRVGQVVAILSGFIGLVKFVGWL